jgi:hypothetical protein
MRIAYFCGGSQNFRAESSIKKHLFPWATPKQSSFLAFLNSGQLISCVKLVREIEEATRKGEAETG